ncbi:hypothetical protein [uncultured Shimia sp.]|uniref:hypothetical protein n=1 Tax=uncultured Shimia sp. TaxID=573152 RepID=UPI0026273F01|nr:hypothetical protein [uncultured Shimia sp.]
MNFFVWFIVATIDFSGNALAERVVLKSGARGDLQTSVWTAPATFGGAIKGNLLHLTVKLDQNRKLHPQQDAQSLCHVYGQREFERLHGASEFQRAANGLFDLDAPLVAVRVSFAFGGGDGLSSAVNRDFDMRGIVKCRPFGQD